MVGKTYRRLRGDQLRVWPPGWFSWSYELNYVEKKTGET
jgi:hypothetical protein